MKHASPDAGFTIVELLITILVLGAVIVTLTNLFLGVRNTQNQAGYLQSATHAAQREVETLRNDSYNSLTPGQNIDFTNQLPSTLRNGNGTVVVSAPIADLRRVDVTVSYKANGQTRQITISSTIGVIGISQ